MENRFNSERQLFDTVCHECQRECQVPFKPAEGRPVYCRDCYRAKNPIKQNDKMRY
jgi:CxxC-x17-CxxC domain-containing protein